MIRPTSDQLWISLLIYLAAWAAIAGLWFYFRP